MLYETRQIQSLKAQSYQYSTRNTNTFSYKYTPMNLVNKSSSTVQGKHTKPQGLISKIMSDGINSLHSLYAD